MEKPFKRINFYKGLFATAEDWQRGEQYHHEKRELHNKYFHRAGIVPNCLDGLKVTASEDGRNIQISSGLALDGEGRELYLSSSLVLPIEEYPAATTVFVDIRYSEEPTERRDISTNSEDGFAFIEELPKVSLRMDEPDNASSLELARIAFAKDAKRVANARNPGAPGPNEIDTRYIRRAPVFRGALTLEDFTEVVKEGEISVVSRHGGPSKEDTNVQIEQVKGSGLHRFYLASVYPIGLTEQGAISWRIETFFRNGNTDYRLYFSNQSEDSVRVAYRVMRFR